VRYIHQADDDGAVAQHGTAHGAYHRNSMLGRDYM